MIRLKLNRRSAQSGDRGGPPHQPNKRELGGCWEEDVGREEEEVQFKKRKGRWGVAGAGGSGSPG